MEPLAGENPVNSEFLVALFPDIPAVHSDTQELPAGTFTAPITGLFVGHPPVIRRMAPALN